MIIVLQYPFADASQFIADRLPRLVCPSWPFPEHGEFLRSAGSIVSRKGFPDWIPEPRVCDARNAIKFREAIIIPLNKRQKSLTLLPVAKRFYFDGRATGKLEIVLRPKSSKGADLGAISPELLANIIASTPVQMAVATPHGVVRREILIRDYYKELPFQWLGMTTAFQKLEEECSGKYWIGASPPSLMIVGWSHQQLDRWRFDQNWMVGDERQQSLQIGYSKCGAKSDFSSMWTMFGKRSARDFARAMRITLLRLHAESTSLRFILKFIGSSEFNCKPRSEQSNLLQLYLHRSATQILKLLAAHPDGTATKVMQLAYQVYDESTQGELELVLEKLRSTVAIRPNYFRELKNVLAIGQRQNHFYKERATFVTNYNIDNKGQIGQIGDRATAEGFLFSQGNPTSQEIQVLLPELKRLLAAVKELPNDENTTIASSSLELAVAAAEAGNGWDVVKALRSAGKWTFDFATKIGVAVAAEAVKKSLGL